MRQTTSHQMRHCRSVVCLCARHHSQFARSSVLNRSSERTKAAAAAASQSVSHTLHNLETQITALVRVVILRTELLGKVALFRVIMLPVCDVQGVPYLRRHRTGSKFNLLARLSCTLYIRTVGLFALSQPQMKRGGRLHTIGNKVVVVVVVVVQYTLRIDSKALQQLKLSPIVRDSVRLWLITLAAKRAGFTSFIPS